MLYLRVQLRNRLRVSRDFEVNKNRNTKQCRLPTVTNKDILKIGYRCIATRANLSWHFRTSCIWGAYTSPPMGDYGSTVLLLESAYGKLPWFRVQTRDHRHAHWRITWHYCIIWRLSDFISSVNDGEVIESIVLNYYF